MYFKENRSPFEEVKAPARYWVDIVSRLSFHHIMYIIKQQQQCLGSSFKSYDDDDARWRMKMMWIVY